MAPHFTAAQVAGLYPNEKNELKFELLNGSTRQTRQDSSSSRSDETMCNAQSHHPLPSGAYPIYASMSLALRQAALRDLKSTTSSCRLRCVL